MVDASIGMHECDDVCKLICKRFLCSPISLWSSWSPPSASDTSLPEFTHPDVLDAPSSDHPISHYRCLQNLADSITLFLLRFAPVLCFRVPGIHPRLYTELDEHGTDRPLGRVGFLACRFTIGPVAGRYERRPGLVWTDLPIRVSASLL